MDEVRENKIEDILINYMNSMKEKKNYDFELEYENGLNYATDESLELAYQIILKGNIELSAKDSKTIIIENDLYGFCENKNTTEQLLSRFKKGDNLNTKRGAYTIYGSTPLERICYGCNYQRCPKHLAGYIFYLMSKGTLEEKLEARAKFRANNKLNDIYTFEWNYGDVLRIIPDKTYEFCKKLVDENLVYVDKYLIEPDNLVKIHTTYSCSDFKMMFEDASKIENTGKPFNDWRFLKRNPNKPFGYCNEYSCGLQGCVSAIAGVIYYLKTLGRDDVLEEERKYYHEHQEEMDKKREEQIEKHKSNINDEINKSLEAIGKYKDSVDRFDDLVLLLTNKNQKSLHCIIEGNDDKEREKLIEHIVKLLDKDYLKIRLQNLTAGNVYLLNESLQKEEKDDRGVPYKGSEVIRYTNLKENQIYVITNLKEFVNDYKLFKSMRGDYSHAEVRKKQHEHIIDLLTQISYSNYIIIEGTTKEVDEFIELEPKLQYIYQNARFKMTELSLDEVFKNYMSKLNNTLFKECVANEEKYKKQFMEYVSFNKNFIPFNNRELAAYLALYSNSKDDLVFPENIYKKETVEEALRSIVGLETVKKKVKEFEKYMMFKVSAEAQGLKLASSNMHMIFTGNPGTGKTTIARIMAKMLYDMGIIKENKLIEVERKDLVAEYTGQTASKTAGVISEAMGGVLFIDEAYSLAGGSKNDFGAEAIATLIKAMEDHKDEFVVIFAGYKDEMGKFLDINPGISSRIGYTFDFPDYTADELIQIFNIKLAKMGFECDEKCEAELKRICSYFYRRKAFGNGRFVDKLIQETIMKHAIREENSLNIITEQDIPTIRELNNTTETEESTEDMLSQIIGLTELKEKIKEFEAYVKFVKEAEKSGIKVPNQNMHMIFTGNPGTGKTTIARIMVKILYNAGIIQENKLIEVERKDLIGQYVGQTAPKTYEVIEKAMGGVLFIDEAYSLASEGKNDFGAEAVATLIKAMEDHKGEFVVIFAGYKKEMGEFLNINSGIASRIGYIFDFADYTREELAEILYKKIAKSNLEIEEKAKDKVLQLMNYFCDVENIGNGRFADKVLQEIILNHAKNMPSDISLITEQDIPTIQEMTKSLFNGENMINPDIIKEEDLRKTAIHEIGHALVRKELYSTPGIIKITINPEGGGSLGYVRHKNEQGKYTHKKSELLNIIKVSLAGMAAEEIFIGEYANGNTSDLKHATAVARNMVTKYGMSNLGLGRIENPDGVLEEKVQMEINNILSKCFEETKQIILANKENMLKTIEFLLKEKEMDEEQLLKL